MPLKGHGKKSKNLFPFYDPGVDADDDVQSFVNSQREHNHRTRQPAAEVRTEFGNPNAGGSGPNNSGGGNTTGPPGPPGPAGKDGKDGTNGTAGPDRLHKTNGVDYIFVGKDHYPGEDPVINPGYRTVGAPFSSITDALNYAETVVIPKLIDPTQRVSIFVIGGTWNEDVTINSSIKLIGLGGGRPLITGRVVINPADDVLLANFEIFDQSFDARFPTAALTIGVMPDIGDTRPNVVLENIWCRGSGYSFQSSSRFWANNCRFYCEEDATAFAVNISFSPGWKRFAEFTNCHFYGSRLIPYPPLETNTGMAGYRGGITLFSGPTGGAIKISTRVSPASASFYANDVTAGTGVVLFGCQVFGYASCEGWALGHYHCRLNGGFMDFDTLGTTYCKQTANSSSTNIDSEVWFDHCHIRARTAVAHFDFTAFGAGINFTKIRDSTFGTDDPLQRLPTVAQRNGAGYVTVVKSATDGPKWYDAGVSNVNMFIYDSIMNIPAIAMNDPYYP